MSGVFHGLATGNARWGFQRAIRTLWFEAKVLPTSRWTHGLRKSGSRARAPDLLDEDHLPSVLSNSVGARSMAARLLECCFDFDHRPYSFRIGLPGGDRPVAGICRETEFSG